MVEHVIKKMDDYYLSKEDWDAAVELGIDDRKDAIVLKKISTATKAMLTRKYNTSKHPIPFYNTSDLSGVLRKVDPGPVPDIEDIFHVSVDPLNIFGCLISIGVVG